MSYVDDLFNLSKDQMLVKPEDAETNFKIIVQILENHECSELTKWEKRMLAKCHQYLFFISRLQDLAEAERAIHCYEAYFEEGCRDMDSVDSYITVLELSYQYEKARDHLLHLLNDEELRALALKHLSSYAYCANGLQSIDEYNHYNEERGEKSQE